MKDVGHGIEVLSGNKKQSKKKYEKNKRSLHEDRYGDKRNAVRERGSGSGKPEFKHGKPGRSRLFGERHTGKRAQYDE